MIAGVMVPLAVLSGQPVYGCICADGHYELFCQAGRCPGKAKAAAANPGSTAACCGCSCCADAGPKDASHACCKARVAGLARAACGHQSGNSSAQHVGNKGCCTPVVQQATVATVVAAPQALDDHWLPALYVTTLDVNVFESAAHAHGAFPPDFGSPPRDLVVTLQRLVI